MRKSTLRSAAVPLPFDLRALEIFLAVAEAQSFTAAAKRLGLTQSAVSQTVGQLEREFAVSLIDRKLKPLALTIAGTVLHEQARALLEEARRAFLMVREAAALKLPIVRIGMIDSVFPLLAPVLGVELRAYADQLSIMSGLSDPHRMALLNRTIDISITTDAIEDVDGMERFSLLEEPFILLLPASYRQDGEFDLAQLATELPLIRYTERSHTGRQIELYLRRLRLDVPRGQAYDGTAGLVSMVAAGLGWAITTPLCMLDAHSPANRIRCAPLPSPGTARQLTLVARSGELGSIPSRIASLARQILEERGVPEILRMMPWLEGKLKVG